MIGCISAKDKNIGPNVGPNANVSGLEDLSVQVTHIPKWIHQNGHFVNYFKTKELGLEKKRGCDDFPPCTSINCDFTSGDRVSTHGLGRTSTRYYSPLSSATSEKWAFVEEFSRRYTSVCPLF